jgi:hypothetical protein
MAKSKAVAVAGGVLYLTLAAAAACPFPMREEELSLTAQVARNPRCSVEALWQFEWRTCHHGPTRGPQTGASVRGQPCQRC